jgi:hypothetical protein
VVPCKSFFHLGHSFISTCSLDELSPHIDQSTHSSVIHEPMGLYVWALFCFSSYAVIERMSLQESFFKEFTLDRTKEQSR